MAVKSALTGALASPFVDECLDQTSRFLKNEVLTITAPISITLFNSYH